LGGDWVFGYEMETVYTLTCTAAKDTSMQNISAGAIGGRTMYSAVNKTRRQSNRPYESKQKLTRSCVFYAPAAQLRSLRPVHAPPVRAEVAHVLPRALRRGAAKVTLEPTVVEPSGEGVHVRLQTKHDVIQIAHTKITKNNQK